MKVNYPMGRPDSLGVERLVNDLLQKKKIKTKIKTNKIKTNKKLSTNKNKIKTI